MIISYIVLSCLSLCFLGLTVARYSSRLDGVLNRRQSAARNPQPQIDPKESLRRMVEDRYGSGWRVTSTDNGELH